MESVDNRTSPRLSELEASERSFAEPADVSTKIEPGPVRAAAAACEPFDGCSRYGSWTDCEYMGDTDCGEPFCRVPGAQCNQELSTFQRVEHWFVCTRPSGGECWMSEIGRYLVACGC